MDPFEAHLKKKSYQGKIESKVWRHRATLRDILDVMDEINEADISPKQKLALHQKIINFGQVLSLQIYLGQREVPESDDNETIKEFNLRMQHNAYDKYHSDKYSGEPKHGNGYFDENGKFVYVHHYTSGVDENVDEDMDIVTGGGSFKNPRWHPIPLKETPVTPVPIHEGDSIEPKPITNNGDGVVPPIPGDKDSNGGVVPPVSEVVNNDEVNNPTTTETKEKSGSKKRRIAPVVLPPLVAGALALGLKECQPSDTLINDPHQDTTEHVIPVTPQFNETESNYLEYTVEKGKAMLNNQGVQNYDAVYDNFVENIDKVPNELKEIIAKYNMGTAKDNNLGIDINEHPQITATTLILMAESYPNIAPVIHNQLQNPGAEISKAQISAIVGRCQLAKQAQIMHCGADDVNQISDIDYGLYGADKETGPSVKFETKKESKDYTKLVTDVFDYGSIDKY